MVSRTGSGIEVGTGVAVGSGAGEGEEHALSRMLKASKNARISLVIGYCFETRSIKDSF
jgi:hypothetical protein